MNTAAQVADAALYALQAEMRAAAYTPSRPLRKGDRVMLFTSWDGKGTVVFTEYTVASAGRVQVHLLDSNGRNAEFRGYTRDLNAYPWDRATVLLSDFPDFDARAFALQLAETFIRNARAMAECKLARPDYNHQGIRERLAVMAPRVLSRAEADAEVEARVARRAA